MSLWSCDDYSVLKIYEYSSGDIESSSKYVVEFQMQSQHNPTLAYVAHGSIDETLTGEALVSAILPTVNAKVTAINSYSGPKEESKHDINDMPVTYSLLLE
jgi:hypothetical protein